MHQVGVWILLHEHIFALAGAVVGLVAFRRNDPVPAKSLKVHSEGVATAARLTRVLVAVQAQVPSGPLCVLQDSELHEWVLGEGEQKQL